MKLPSANKKTDIRSREGVDIRFLIDALEDLKLAFGAVIRRGTPRYSAEMTVKTTLTSKAAFKCNFKYGAFALGEQ